MHLYYLLHQLLLNQHANASNSLLIPRPPQLVPPSLGPNQSGTLTSPSHLLWTTDVHSPLPQFLAHLRPSATHTPHIPTPQPHPKSPVRLPIIMQATLARPLVRVCTFMFKEGRCRPPQPLGWLVPIYCDFHKALWSKVLRLDALPNINLFDRSGTG